MMSDKENDLFFSCSLIELISRLTHNKKEYIVKTISLEGLERIYSLASVFHCENILKIADEIIERHHIKYGNYFNTNYKNRIPTYFEIGAVYKELIKRVSKSEDDYVKTMYEVLSSWIIKYIDNYDSSMYFENPDYIYLCYTSKKIL